MSFSSYGAQHQDIEWLIHPEGILDPIPNMYLLLPVIVPIVVLAIGIIHAQKQLVARGSLWH